MLSAYVDNYYILLMNWHFDHYIMAFFVSSDNFFKRFYLFLERRREGEIKGEKHQCVASQAPATGDLACNSGMKLDWESNQQLFGLQASTQSTEPCQQGHNLLLKVYFVWYNIGSLALVCLPFAWNIFFHPFIFNLCLSLKLKWISWDLFFILGSFPSCDGISHQHLSYHPAFTIRHLDNVRDIHSHLKIYALM